MHNNNSSGSGTQLKNSASVFRAPVLAPFCTVESKLAVSKGVTPFFLGSSSSHGSTGLALTLVLAAFIEAFWSSRELAPQIKYGVGAACWALLALYLLFAGRRQGGRHGPE